MGFLLRGSCLKRESNEIKIAVDLFLWNSKKKAGSLCKNTGWNITRYFTICNIPELDIAIPQLTNIKDYEWYIG